MNCRAKSCSSHLSAQNSSRSSQNLVSDPANAAQTLQQTLHRPTGRTKLHGDIPRRDSVPEVQKDNRQSHHSNCQFDVFIRSLTRQLTLNDISHTTTRLHDRSATCTLGVHVFRTCRTWTRVARQHTFVRSRVASLASADLSAREWRVRMIAQARVFFYLAAETPILARYDRGRF